ncbi:MAG: gamma-glutamyl-gamma-aminobutyrate hydrolase family protein [Nitrospirota bacterium]
MKPTIGITPDFTPGDDKTESSFSLRSRYISVIEECGGVPLILPLTNSSELISLMLEKIDGVMLTGSGPDIDPALYEEEKRFDFKVMCRERTAFELSIARMAMEREKPIFGICGGMQMINVAAGGSLYQDITLDLPGSLSHQWEAASALPTHSIAIRTGSLLFKIAQKKEVIVNSSHHQCLKNVASGFMVNATSPDGVIEGIESIRKGFSLGVQWHPEYLFRDDPINRRIIDAFLRRCMSD